MNIKVTSEKQGKAQAQAHIIGAYCTTKAKKSTLNNSHWSKEYKEAFSKVTFSKQYTGGKGESFSFYLPNGTGVFVIGLGDKKKHNRENLRKNMATVFKALKAKKLESILVDLDGLNFNKKTSETAHIVAESIYLTDYEFSKYKNDYKPAPLKSIQLYTNDKKAVAESKKQVDRAKKVADCVNYTRDLVNEVPNVLNSEVFAKTVEKDARQNLKGVTLKVLNKTQIKKEKMNLLLAVNAGSSFEPRLVHLTYTPSKTTKKTKHVALVGKGITFDTGGYSLKPSGSIMGMKFDMGGAATLYGAFRLAVMLKSPYKVTCVLAMTDNAISGLATLPDSVIKGRSGKTVEILNTDAEGRLILADALDYACDQKPDEIIDAATLTGACLVALGKEVCGLMGNNDQLANALLAQADKQDEYLWQLPIKDEWRKDMKSKIADLKNIGGSRFAGTPKAAAFLEEFIREGIHWAHLDIAGVAEGQSHLPYCPDQGGSGLMVRTVANYLLS